MDTRQWIEPPGASDSILPPCAPLPSNGHNVVIPWPGHDLFYPQPMAQGFIPEAIGAPWPFGFQNMLDQSNGVFTAFPPAYNMNYDEHCTAIASVTPDVRRPLSRLVPQRPYTTCRRSRSVRSFKLEESIYFNTSSSHGFSMKDALDKNFKGLSRREDPMLPSGTAVSLRFEFKGYDSWTCQVKTRDSRKIPHPIPREKLAHEVAKKLVVFLRKRKPKLGEVGLLDEEATALDSVNVKDLVLVRLDHVSKSSWQPQFTIVRDA